MTVTATYIGKNNELGYISGNDYRLSLTQFQTGSIIVHRPEQKKDMSSHCKFKDMVELLSSWKGISLVDIHG